jgi:hypothetical protein
MHNGGARFRWNSMKTVDPVRTKIPDIAKEFVVKNQPLSSALNRVLCNSISETSGIDVEYFWPVFGDTLCPVSPNIPGRSINLIPYFKLIFVVHQGLFLIFLNPWGKISDWSHRIASYMMIGARRKSSDLWPKNRPEGTLSGSENAASRLISLIKFDCQEAYYLPFVTTFRADCNEGVSFPFRERLPQSHERNIESECVARVRIEYFLNNVQAMKK